MAKELKQIDVINAYRDEYYFVFDFTPSILIKDKKLIGKMVGEFGIDVTKDLLLGIIKNWEKIKAKKRLETLPSIGLIYGYRYFLLDFLKPKHGEKKQQTIERDSIHSDPLSDLDS